MAKTYTFLDGGKKSGVPAVIIETLLITQRLASPVLIWYRPYINDLSRFHIH